MASVGFSIPGILERWKNDWIDPALGYIEGTRGQTDSHLNDVSIEYPEDDVRTATRDFDFGCMLGSGTFGMVYKGTMRDGTEVAIKVLQVPEEAGFEEEVKVLSRFRHPNLVILMGFARHEKTGGRSLIYEYLAGGDVSKRLQRCRQNQDTFEWWSRLSVALDAASGLSHLHNLPVRAFHRDIKGPNILLDKNGTAKMADFGLSCMSRFAQHKVAQASGTVGYACPEYIRSGVITEGSEVHSFGMVLLELLTGAPPAVQKPDKPNEFCYLVDHLQGNAANVMSMLDPTGHFTPSVSHRLTDISFKCITSNPAERPLFKQLVEELRQLMQEEGRHEGPQLPPGPQDASAGRRQLKQQPTLPPQPRPSLPQGASVGGGAHLLPMVPAGLAVGYAVEARWRGGLGWFRGQIARSNGNGTFAVRYDDNDFEDSVPAHHIRLPDKHMAQPQAYPGHNHVRRVTPSPRQGHGTVPQAQGGPSPPRPTTPAPPPQQSPPKQVVAVHAQADGPGLGPPPQQRQQRPVQAHVVGDKCPDGRLICVFAESVELGMLAESQRTIEFPAQANEMVVGRTAQPAMFWDTLVPDRRLHGTVSREHLKVTRKLTSESTAYYLSCLSLNGLLLNGEFIRQGTEERRLQHKDIVAFAASSEMERGGIVLTRKRFVAFSFDFGTVASATHASAPKPMVAIAKPVPRPTMLSATASFAGEVCMPEGCVASRRRTTEEQLGPRQLPELDDADDGDDGPLVERNLGGGGLATGSAGSSGFGHPVLGGLPVASRAAGALRPPTSVPHLDLVGGETPSSSKAETAILDSASAFLGAMRSSDGGDAIVEPKPLQTKPLAPPSDEEALATDLDDLFAKTGFPTTAEQVAMIPARASAQLGQWAKVPF
mmetsp:Transcript_40261/g.110763  ORF Transcript_40261/g.110763 Transcript_40261/m.110763 type:complete len:882 (-) Transcript_40261:84-2729(-)